MLVFLLCDLIVTKRGAVSFCLIEFTFGQVLLAVLLNGIIWLYRFVKCVDWGSEKICFH